MATIFSQIGTAVGDELKALVSRLTTLEDSSGGPSVDEFKVTEYNDDGLVSCVKIYSDSEHTNLVSYKNYIYDSEGSLIQIDSYVNDILVDITKFTFDSDGNLANSNTDTTPDPNDAGGGGTDDDDDEPTFPNLYDFDLDGIDDYIAISPSSSIPVYGFSAWVYLDTDLDKSTAQGIVCGPSGTNWILALGGDYTSTLSDEIISVNFGARYGFCHESQVVSVGWHHMMAVWSENSQTNSGNQGYDIYLDGVNVGNQANTDYGSASLYTIPVGTFRLGQRANNAYPFGGKLDEVSIFTSLLSSYDVSLIYNLGNVGDITSLNPYGWWRMGDNNNGEGLIITDQGIGGNDGTIVGVPFDSDGDGVVDQDDAFPNDPNETADTDGDGVGDNSDAFPNDASETVDSDSDGVGDNSDAFPNDASETVDTDGDGVGDNADAFPNDPNETADTDGDGVGDNADYDPNDPNVQNPPPSDPIISSPSGVELYVGAKFIDGGNVPWIIISKSDADTYEMKSQGREWTIISYQLTDTYSFKLVFSGVNYTRVDYPHPQATHKTTTTGHWWVHDGETDNHPNRNSVHDVLNHIDLRLQERNRSDGRRGSHYQYVPPNDESLNALYDANIINPIS